MQQNVANNKAGSSLHSIAVGSSLPAPHISLLRNVCRSWSYTMLSDTFTPLSCRFNTPIFLFCIMEALHRPMEMGRMGTRIAKYDSDKITKIREKIEVVFGKASTWNDVVISERYNITPDGDLIMIIR